MRGVYFLANDAVFHLAAAMLNSFREHNPDIALCHVPFDAHTKRVESLRDQYRFSSFDRPELLRACDEISTKFHDRVRGHYRKLAMWEGPFDEFLYLDVDSIVLERLDFVFPLLVDYAFVVGDSHEPSNVRHVWKETIRSTGALDERQIGYAANTGFVASTRGAITLAEAQEKLPLALRLAPHMELHCVEQPLLNYLMVTSNRAYSGLNVLSRRNRELPIYHYAAMPGRIDLAGGIELERGRAAVVHWSGLWQPRPLDQKIHRLLRALRLRPAKSRPKIRYFVPSRALWKYYRARHDRDERTFRSRSPTR